MIKRLMAFLALGLGDLYLTWSLLTHSSGRFYESNPLASFILEQFGWWGLGAFKMLVLATVGILAKIIFVSRPRTAGHLLTLGCFIQFTVVAYSALLLNASQKDDTIPKVVEIRKRMDVILDYRSRVHRLMEDYLGGRCSFSHAISTLAKHPRMAQPEWQQHLRKEHPDTSLYRSLQRSFITYIEHTQCYLSPVECAQLRQKLAESLQQSRRGGNRTRLRPYRETW